MQTGRGEKKKTFWFHLTFHVRLEAEPKPPSSAARRVSQLPADPFIISVPQNPSIDISELHKFGVFSDFEALKSRFWLHVPCPNFLCLCSFSPMLMHEKQSTFFCCPVLRPHAAMQHRWLCIPWAHTNTANSSCTMYEKRRRRYHIQERKNKQVFWNTHVQ